MSDEPIKKQDTSDVINGSVILSENYERGVVGSFNIGLSRKKCVLFFI